MMKSLMRLLLLGFVFAGSAQGHTMRVPADFNSITSALKMFQLKLHRYPTGEEGLRALVERPASIPESAPWMKLMDSVPRDPWGNEYGYVEMSAASGGFGLYSNGPDGVSMTHGNDPDDLNSWSGDGSDYFLEQSPPWRSRAMWVGLVGLLCGAGFIASSRRKKARPA